jgi:hypothetical protein
MLYVLQVLARSCTAGKKHMALPERRRYVLAKAEVARACRSGESSGGVVARAEASDGELGYR